MLELFLLLFTTVGEGGAPSFRSADGAVVFGGKLDDMMLFTADDSGWVVGTGEQDHRHHGLH